MRDALAIALETDDGRRSGWTVRGIGARRRGWVVRRLLLAADAVGLTAALVLALAVAGDRGVVEQWRDLVLFVLTLPCWVIFAKLQGLYDHDEERTDHSTVDDIAGVFHFVTVGTWVVGTVAWMFHVTDSSFRALVIFWAIALVLVTLARVSARALARITPAYVQNTLIVGADDVGQLIARKILHHPEYGLNLVGFIDGTVPDLREDIAHVPFVGAPDAVPQVVRDLDVERVIIAFPRADENGARDNIRALRDIDVQVDIVPRLHDIVGSNVSLHTLEGLPLIGLPALRIARSSRLIKRTIDVVIAGTGLLLLAPLFAFVAWRIRRDSAGPALFRQKRLGQNMRSFTALKFRTMKVGTSPEVHREHVRCTATSAALPSSNGLYKLDRDEAVTRTGRWLRRTSIDELPQLVNVLRGEMSLVGPRPCIPYELEHFEPHHFERFLVPAGLTGLWQVTARAHATFGEALDMDVAYVRAWSLGLDMRLLLRTPIQVARSAATR